MPVPPPRGRRPGIEVLGVVLQRAQPAFEEAGDGAVYYLSSANDRLKERPEEMLETVFTDHPQNLAPTRSKGTCA